MSLVSGFQPLYKQVYDVLVARIVGGEWRPTEPLPSEHALAEQLGVSQGTVRKALNSMVAENLLERRQGKGTYVAEHTQENSLFRFFRLAKPNGEAVTPESSVVSVTRRVVKPREREMLNADTKAKVVEIVRVRSINGVPSILEIIVQPLSLFPDIDQLDELPNTLYTLYQSHYGISVSEVRERLRAVLATKVEAKQLGVALGAPLLCIDRVALSINGTPIEWRRSYCDTKDLVYTVSLR